MDSSIQKIGDKITFQDFCNVCEKIRNTKEHPQKTALLSKYFDECRKLVGDNSSADLYPVLRLLLPLADRDRGPYGIKEIAFARLYIRILSLPKQGHDALKLLNYKAPSSSVANAADFAESAFWVLKSRFRSNVGSMTLDEINTHLNDIASFNADNAPRLIDDLLTKLTTSLPVIQQKWLIRIILKDLKLGIGQAKILSIFHSDASDLFDSTNNLVKVCRTLLNPSINLHEIEVEIFSPFRPMLSDRLDIVKINSVIKKDNIYLLETKFDGERFQIHMKNGKFKYFSRNGFDYTEQYGQSFDAEGALTKSLDGLFDKSANSFIIDGEMMGWHKKNKAFSSKGINFDVKKITKDSVFQPCFCAFDILLYNDVILTNKPLIERLKFLDELFTDKEGIILHSKRMQVNDSNSILEALNKAIDDQEEGLVLKTINSVYKPNSRKGGWYKIKPEYTDGVMNELDFLIVGGYYAENKRYGNIGSVLLGVAVTSENKDENPTVFYACGKVKLTLIREELEEICSKLNPHWIQVKKDFIPPSVCWTKDKPDVWIEPRNSFIVQVKASELVRSNEFKTNYTVRFPRVEKVRYDKPWYDSISLDEFNKLTQYSHGVEKLTSRNIAGDDIEMSETSPKKRAKLLNIAAHFQPVQETDVQEKSNLFSGKEFCIITGNQEVSKSDLEIKIIENGGQIVQNPGENTFCIIAGIINARVTNAIHSGKFNIATIEWLFKTLDKEYISSGEILKWTPIDLIGTSNKLAEEFVLKYDEYGDSFADVTTREKLNHAMKKVKELSIPVHLLPHEFADMDEMLFNGHSPYSFMRSCTVYFNDDFYELTTLQRIKVDMLKLNLQLYAGTCCDKIDIDTTHIVLLSVSDDNAIEHLCHILQSYDYPPKVMKIDWLVQCIEQKYLLDEDDYKIEQMMSQ